MNYDITTGEGMSNAVRWTQATFDAIKNGGKWAVPRSGTLITIEHEHKTAYIQRGHTPDEGIEQVIEAMGWTVVVLDK
jgi:hypothetical protein